MLPTVARSFTAVARMATAQAGSAAPALLQASNVLAGSSCSCTGPCKCQSLPRVLARSLHAHAPPKTPEEALNYLRQGNARFIYDKHYDRHPTRNMDRVKAVAAGQAPFAALLSCADSRVPVEIIFDQGFGDVFVTRVAGNIVSNEIIGSLEFGTAVLGAKVLMVLGHSACGAVAATMAGGEVPGVISSLYYSIKPAIDTIENENPSMMQSLYLKLQSIINPAVDKEKSLDDAIKANVQYQVEQLKVSPVLSGLVKEGKLVIVGGVYDLASGKVTEVAGV